MKAAAAAGILAALRRPASALESGQVSRGGAWALGDKLSLAGLLYAQEAKQNLIDETLGSAKSIAAVLGVQIPPFPARGADRPSSDAEIIHYLIQGDGAMVGKALAEKYGQDHGILFEVSVKSNLLLFLYAPGDKLGSAIAEVIQSRCQSIKLPPQFWQPTVTLINNRGSTDQVRDAVFKMHKDVTTYYLGS